MSLKQELNRTFLFFLIIITLASLKLLESVLELYKKVCLVHRMSDKYDSNELYHSAT